MLHLSFWELWQSIDDWSQIHQRLVYIAAFFESLPCALFGPFWTSQVDKIELSASCVDHSIFGIFWLNLHGEDWMRSWAGLIVKSRAYMPWLRPFIQKIHNLFTSRDSLFSDSFYIDTFPSILT